MWSFGACWCRLKTSLRRRRKDVVARATLAGATLRFESIFVERTLSQVHTPLPAETPFDQSLRGRVDISDVSILRKGLQSHHYLRTFVGDIP